MSPKPAPAKVIAEAEILADSASAIIELPMLKDTQGQPFQALVTYRPSLISIRFLRQVSALQSMGEEDVDVLEGLFERLSRIIQSWNLPIEPIADSILDEMHFRDAAAILYGITFGGMPDPEASGSSSDS